MTENTATFWEFKARYEALVDEGFTRGLLEFTHDGAIELIDPEERAKEIAQREEERAARKAQQEREYAEMWAAENTKIKEDNE